MGNSIQDKLIAELQEKTWQVNSLARLARKDGRDYVTPEDVTEALKTYPKDKVRLDILQILAGGSGYGAEDETLCAFVAFQGKNESNEEKMAKAIAEADSENNKRKLQKNMMVVRDWYAQFTLFAKILLGAACGVVTSLIYLFVAWIVKADFDVVTWYFCYIFFVVGFAMFYWLGMFVTRRWYV